MSIYVCISATPLSIDRKWEKTFAQNTLETLAELGEDAPEVLLHSPFPQSFKEILSEIGDHNLLCKLARFTILEPDSPPQNISSAVYIDNESGEDLFQETLKKNHQNFNRSLKRLTAITPELLSESWLTSFKIRNFILDKLIVQFKNKEATGVSSIEVEKANEGMAIRSAMLNWKPWVEDIKSELSIAKYFLELNFLCLNSEVLMNQSIHIADDPTFGWLDYDTISLENHNYTILSNPFLSMTLDHKGAIRSVDYYPRKQLLYMGNQTCFSLEDHALLNSSLDQQNSCPSPSNVDSLQLMRKSPDLLVLKSIEQLNCSTYASIQVDVHKILYCKSGLGGFGNDSTTGWSLDFWAEANQEIPEAKQLYLFANICLRSPSSLLRIRNLGVAGGVSETANSIPPSGNLDIRNPSSDGGLYGLRLIDSVNHLVIDYRFTLAIESAYVSCINLGTSEDLGTTLTLRFEIPIKSIFSFDRIQSLHTTIY